MILKQIDDFQLTLVHEINLEHFLEVRKEGMKPHVIRVGLTWDEDYENRYNRDMFEKGLKEKTLFRIEVEGVVVGYVNIIPTTLLTKWIGIWIKQKCRNQGIGTKVLQQIIDDNKDSRLMLNVFKNNPARKLYDKLGFVCYESDAIFDYMYKIT